MLELKNCKKWIVAGLQHGQWATDERERIIKGTAEADGNNVVVVVEQEPGSGGKDSAHATITNLAGFSVFADRPTGDKVYRADPYSVQVNEGNVLLLHGPWIKTFKDEHESFPGLTKDIVDAAAGAFNYLRGKRKAGPVL
jgi:predicted phage terminase large subunit-like protein